jgi:hypothetical protein
VAVADNYNRGTTSTVQATDLYPQPPGRPFKVDGTIIYPENPIQRPPHPTVAQSAIDVRPTAFARSGE